MKIVNVAVSLLLTSTLIGCGSSSSSSDAEADTLSLTYTDLPDGLTVNGAMYVEDIEYGEHERQRFDLYSPMADTPTGLVIFYHGGGFVGGSKESVLSVLDTELPALLEQGYAVISSEYRLLDGTHEEGVLRSLQDSTYALQFIRYHASSLNIDPNNIVLTGSSAGAGASLWIGLQSDMADSDSDDPIEHESTRVNGVALESSPTTFDILRWQEDDNIFGEFDLTDEELITLGGGAALALLFYGLELSDENLADPIEAWDNEAITDYRQSVDMLDFLSSDDPELFANNDNVITRPADTNEFYHHAYHTRALQAEADTASVPGVYYYGPADDRLFESDPIESMGEFMLRKLAE